MAGPVVVVVVVAVAVVVVVVVVVVVFDCRWKDSLAICGGANTSRGP